MACSSCGGRKPAPSIPVKNIKPIIKSVKPNAIRVKR
jgi:hypothetical protein